MLASEAVDDRATAIGRDSAFLTAQADDRLARARAIVETTGATLEDALREVWSSVRFEVLS